MKKSFATTIKELRIKAGFSQKQVCEHFKVPQSTFSSWETGKAEPSADMMLKLCKYYNVPDVLSAFGFDGYNEDGSIVLDLNEIELIEKYRKLDEERKQFLTYILDRELDQMKRLEALIEEEKNQDVELLAAHERTDIEVTEEMVQHDLGLMNDPDF